MAARFQSRFSKTLMRELIGWSVPRLQRKRQAAEDQQPTSVSSTLTRKSFFKAK